MNEQQIIAREEIRPEAERTWNADAKVRAEFGDNFDRYLAYRTAAHTGQARTLGGQVRV